MTTLIFLVIGVSAGAAVGWLAATSQSKAVAAELRAQVGSLQTSLQGRAAEVSNLQQEVRTEVAAKAKAQAELEQSQRSLTEQRQLLQEARKSLSDAFGSLAGEALQKNSAEFLRLAATKFESLQSEAKGDLAQRQQAIDALVNPLKESLDRYEKQIGAIELARQSAYAGLDFQLSGLQKLTGDLNIALRGSHTKVRGRWGELTLHRVAELAGMADHCDFSEQTSFETEAGRQRPDMIVNLAGGRRIPVDSKVPLEAFLGAASAGTEEERNQYLGQHGKYVRTHMERLAKQSYPALFSSSPDIVVMFLPGESFLAAALDGDGTLLEDAMKKRVILATPSVLISLLLAIHHGWQQYALAENAIQIKTLASTLCDCIRNASGHFEDIGYALGKAVSKYNDAIGSLERRFFPASRKFKDLVTPTAEDLAVLAPVEATPRPLISPDWELNAGPSEADLPAGKQAS